jgi:hypothetical protein
MNRHDVNSNYTELPDDTYAWLEANETELDRGGPVNDYSELDD